MRKSSSPLSGSRTRSSSKAWRDASTATFRIGGLAPGETKQIHGKIYIVPNDVAALLARYEKDFPEQKK
jgi:hypothetical protein